MNIKIPVSTGLIAAHLTSVIITSYGPASLAAPVWAIIIYMTAIPEWVIFATHGFGLFSIAAIIATEARITSWIFNKGLIYLVGLAAPLTGASYEVFRAAGIRLWLSSPIFGATLRGTKAGLSVCPRFKLLAAPVANKDGPLGRIAGSPASLQATRLRAKASRCRQVVFKGFSAEIARKKPQYHAGLVTANLATFLRAAIDGVCVIVNELLSANFTNSFVSHGDLLSSAV